MGFWQDIFDVYGTRERGRRMRASFAAERERAQEADWREREIRALEKIAEDKAMTREGR